MQNKLTVAIIMVYTLLMIAGAWGQQQYIDVVCLKNGSIIKGVIIEQVLGVSIKVEAGDGSVFVIKTEDIEKLAKERKPAEAAAKASRWRSANPSAKPTRKTTSYSHWC